MEKFPFPRVFKFEWAAGPMLIQIINDVFLGEALKADGWESGSSKSQKRYKENWQMICDRDDEISTMMGQKVEIES